jgi:hypothetical protein
VSTKDTAILTTSLSDIYTTTGTLGTVTTATNNSNVITTSGAGNLSWNNVNTSPYASPYTINTAPAIVKIECDAEFSDDVKISGVSLDERLNVIEERLGILRPNNDLEGRWEKLKALGEEYRKLEKEILEGESIWDTLKK